MANNNSRAFAALAVSITALCLVSGSGTYTVSTLKKETTAIYETARIAANTKSALKIAESNPDQPDFTEAKDANTNTDAMMTALVMPEISFTESLEDIASAGDAEIKERVDKYKEEHATGGVTMESVAAEAQRRPGLYGRLVIPDVGVNVGLFTYNDQSTVDAVDSALLYGHGSATLIGDHWNQGFERIKRCQVGTKAYIITPTEKQVYTCTGVERGQNIDSDLLDANGVSVGVRSGIVMYTCNGANHHDVTEAFFS